MRVIDDMRGVPDTSKKADLYIVASTMKGKPALGNPSGRVLVSVSATVHYAPAGDVDPLPYNRALADIALRYGAIIDQVLGVEPNGYFTKGIDLTKRGVVAPLLNLWTQNFSWANGFRWDVFTPLTDDLDKWNMVMGSMANALRETGKLVVGQQHQLTQPAMGTNGLFLEQTPTSFGYTMERHADDLRRFMASLANIHDTREVLWISELRWPETLPSWYLAKVFAWAKDPASVLPDLPDGTRPKPLPEIYLSIGYDATAQGTP